MSGLALIFDQNASLTASDPAWLGFLGSFMRLKAGDGEVQVAQERNCLAAKLDCASSLHHGIVEHRLSGSWLLAAGTVIDNADIDPDGRLKRLLEDFLDQGSEVFQRLDGQFVIVLYDGRDGQTRVISDPFAILSVFVGQRGSRVFVSTSALAVAQAVGAAPDELGTRYYLIAGNVPGDITLWTGVAKLAPATVLSLSTRNTESSTYWTLDLDEEAGRLSLNESVDYVIDALSAALRRSLVREGKSWLSLTGGFDSRTLALLVDRANLGFDSYCHGPSNSKDVLIASRICAETNWNYQHYQLPGDWGIERPQWFSQTIGRSEGHVDVFKTSRIIWEQVLKAKRHNVSIWGFGGEIYRGFYWKQEPPLVRQGTTVNYARLVDMRILPRIARPILKDTEVWVRTVRAELISRLQRIGEQQSTWPKSAKLDLVGTVLEGSIHAGAHVSAVMGIQRAITPFYFKSGIQAAMSINAQWRKRNQLFRHMIERMNPNVAHIETADGGPAGPARLRNLPRFAPLYLHEAKKLARALGNRFLGLNLWDGGRGTGSDYPITRWRIETINALKASGVLVPTEMASRELYDRDALERFLLEATDDGFQHEALLSRVATVELAFRELSVSL